MAFEAGDFDATIAAAAGDDPALVAELRRAFAESLAAQVNLLHRARCDANWHIASQRLKGLAASFHAPLLSQLADEALDSAPGDPRVLRKLARLSGGFSDTGLS
jgi:HPt (histidine-containing phosphotransfer) domain-containing protein